MTYQIFIEQEEIPEKKLSNRVSYMYTDGYLRVYNNGRVVYFEEAHKGDAFVIICEKGKAFLKKMAAPQKTGALVAWLLKFNKDNRATSIAEYERLLCREKRRRYWEGYQEREYKSNGYIFMLCNTPIDDNYRNVAGFVSDAISKKEVIELIPLMVHHPEWYVFKQLSEVFGITEEEFREAKKKAKKPL